MKKLLNTLYITTEEAYLSLDGENVLVHMPDETVRAFPLHLLESIILFSYKGASPALMGKCVESGISIAFFSPQGKFECQVGNEVSGNVYLRREQYRWADQDEKALSIAKNMIIGKLFNARYVLHRCLRDHSLQVNVQALSKALDFVKSSMNQCITATDLEQLRGLEGNASAAYFGAFDEMLLRDKTSFFFHGRNRRPPLDRVNALLSFAYALLASDCVAALRGVGLDPYVGFMHTDRPGRKSLALDIMEELRPAYADRFVLTLINNRIIQANGFTIQEGGAVLLNDDTRKTFLSEWQKRKKEELVHPYLEEKITWGLVPHVQALLLARHLRGDLDQYPPFFWK